MAVRFLQSLPDSCSILIICPEEFGGMGTPRVPFDLPAEGSEAVLRGSAPIINHEGQDITATVLEGVERSLNAIQQFKPDLVILKEGSPSCGVNRICVCGKWERGRGLLATALAKSGIWVRGMDKDGSENTLELAKGGHDHARG